MAGSNEILQELTLKIGVDGSGLKYTSKQYEKEIGQMMTSIKKAIETNSKIELFDKKSAQEAERRIKEVLANIEKGVSGKRRNEGFFTDLIAQSKDVVQTVKTSYDVIYKAEDEANQKKVKSREKANKDLVRSEEQLNKKIADMVKEHNKQVLQADIDTLNQKEQVKKQAFIGETNALKKIEEMTKEHNKQLLQQEIDRLNKEEKEKSSGLKGEINYLKRVEEERANARKEYKRAEEKKNKDAADSYVSWWRKALGEKERAERKARQKELSETRTHSRKKASIELSQEKSKIQEALEINRHARKMEELKAGGLGGGWLGAASSIFKYGSIGKFMSPLLGWASKAGDWVAQSISGGIELSQQMAQIKYITKASDEQMARLSNTTKEMAINFGYASEESAKLMLSLSRLGVSAKDMSDVANAAGAVAKATGGDLQQTGELLVQTMNAFGEGFENSNKFADKFVATLNSSAIDVNKFRTILSYVASAGESTGVSFEKASAAISVLANNGLKASQIGTSLRNIFSTAAANGEDLTEMMERLVQANMDYADAAEIFGERAANAAMVLKENWGEVEKAQVQAFNTLTTASEQAASAIDKTLSGQLKRDISGLWAFIKGLVADANTMTDEEIWKRRLDFSGGTDEERTKAAVGFFDQYVKENDINLMDKDPAVIRGIINRFVHVTGEKYAPRKESGFKSPIEKNLAKASDEIFNRVMSHQGKYKITKLKEKLKIQNQDMFNSGSGEMTKEEIYASLRDEAAKYGLVLSKSDLKSEIDYVQGISRSAMKVPKFTGTFSKAYSSVSSGSKWIGSAAKSGSAMAYKYKQRAINAKNMGEDYEIKTQGKAELIRIKENLMAGEQATMDETDYAILNLIKIAQNDYKGRIAEASKKLQNKTIKENEFADIKMNAENELQTNINKANALRETVENEYKKAYADLDAVIKDLGAYSDKILDYLDAVKVADIKEALAENLTGLGGLGNEKFKTKKQAINARKAKEAAIMDNYRAIDKEYASAIVGVGSDILTTEELINDARMGIWDRYDSNLMGKSSSEVLAYYSERRQALEKKQASYTTSKAANLKAMGSFQNSINKNEENDKDESLKAWMGVGEQSMDVALEAYKTFNQIVLEETLNRINEEIAAEQRKTEKIKEINSSMQKLGLISAEQYAKEQERLEREQIDKENELNEKAFNEQKKAEKQQASADFASNIAKMAMQTYVAWSSVVGGQAIAAGIVAATTALMTAQYGVQLAAISKKKFVPQKYEDGGYVTGASHVAGGIPISVGGDIREMEGGEFIVNKRATARNLALLTAINESGKYANGGYVSGSPAKLSGGYDTISRVADVLENLSNNPIRAYVSVTDVNEGQKRLSNSKSRGFI